MEMKERKPLYDILLNFVACLVSLLVGSALGSYTLGILIEEQSLFIALLSFPIMILMGACLYFAIKSLDNIRLIIIINSEVQK